MQTLTHFRNDYVDHGLAHVRGLAEPQPYEMRFLCEDEVEQIYELHRLVVSKVEHPHMFRPDDRAFIAQQIERRGRTVGTFCLGRLVAYAAISFPDGDPDNLGRDLPLPEPEWGCVANYDGSAVHPDFRGNRLQNKMTAIRHRWALAHGRHHILGTVSPLNPVSLANFVGLGCRVKNLKTKYGTMQRFIIHLDLRDPDAPILDPHTALDLPLDRIEAHKALLRQGFQGFRVIAGADEALLRYAQPDVAAAARPLTASA